MGPLPPPQRVVFFFLTPFPSLSLPPVPLVPFQVTINCAERGLLLLRVRDEMRMTIMAYQTLYESSVAFGEQHQPRVTLWVGSGVWLRV